MNGGFETVCQVLFLLQCSPHKKCTQFCFTDPSDYAAREVTATFLPGETTANACIPIVDDDVHECLEWFTLELSLTQAAVDLCAVLSSPFTARVRIEDNDG